MSGRFWSTVLLVAAACLLVSGPVSAQAGQGVGDTERRSGVLGETASDRPLDRVPGELFEGDPAGPGVGEFWKPDRLGADFWGIFPLGPGVPPEACCLPDGACINLNPVVCVLIGGKRGGPGSSCATEKCVVFGACCFPDLTCELLATEAACLASGGKWLAGEGCGPGLACKITGACCLPDGQCDSRVTLFDCIDRGGEWHVYQGFEPDVVIDPCSTVTCFGACWIPPDGSGAVGECLLNRTAEQCEADGGFFQGYGSTGCAADPVCGREVQVVNFRRTHTDQLPPILVPFRKFDDMGGTRRLKFASLAIDAEVVHRIVLVNVSGQIGSPTFIPAIITLRTDVTRGPLPEFGLPLPEELLNFFDDNVGCPGVPALEFAESCDFGGHIRSIVPSYFHSITDNLGGLVGAGETLDVSVEGTTLAISQFTFANVVNPINELEGVLTVIYEFEMLGACCFECPEWQPCKVLFEDECIAEGGIWQGPMTTCSPDLCEPPLGACCFECPDWQPCSELTEAACLAAGGTWQGPCTTCTPDPCDPPLGACCFECPDWQPCSELTQAACLAAGGTWQGPCTTCTPDPCDPPLGACCFECPDWQPCSELTEAACLAAGGTWQGPCTTCTPDPCVPPLGACCFECPDWQPCSELTEAACLAAGGTWQGPCTTCTPDPCDPPLGACCFECPDWQPCSELTEAACLAAGGTWQGPCTTCTPDPCDPPPGACCIPCPDWQPCQILTQAECLAAGGTWQGACTDCTPDPCELPTGACCFECPDWQPCMVVTEAACVAAGGSWQGPCTVCDPCPPPPGACCIPCPDWQPCQILTQAECLAAGGIWQGACTDCTPDPCEPPTGACCFECPDWQPCVVVTQQVCIDMGGSWQGECTVCDPCPPPPGACCIPSGLMIICEELTEEECFAQGGEFWAGPCTTCDTTDCPGCTRGCTHKGSVVVYSKIEIRWNADGQLIQDTFISLSNDHQDDVLVQFFFINGDPPLEATADEREHPGWNFLDNKILLTGNQPTWWSAATGAGYGVSPFTVLDPGTPPGRPAMDGTTDRVLRGWIVGWAVNHLGEEIRWNHLSGTGTLVYYDRDGAAWEYIACAITSTTQGIPHGGKLPNPGTLVFDGTEYCDLPSHLLLNFQAVHSTAWSTPQVQVTSDTDLTLHPLDADLRLNSVTEGVPVTWAKFDVWNEMEVKFSGMGRCISCWDQTLLRFYGSPNHTLLTTLQTDHGKARIEGIQHPNCPTSVPRALLGVHARWLTFSASGGEDRIAAAGGNLIGMGSQGAVIRHDAFGDYPPEAPIILEEVPGPFDQADRLIDQLLQQSSRRSSGR